MGLRAGSRLTSLSHHCHPQDFHGHRICLRLTEFAGEFRGIWPNLQILTLPLTLTLDRVAECPHLLTEWIQTYIALIHQ